MESTFKRRRLVRPGDSDGGLQARRAQQELQLKSRFESIFEKYEKDFTGVGDEIDLETGHVIIDNGHIERMRYETDIGNGLPDRLLESGDSDTEPSDDESTDSSVEMVVDDLHETYDLDQEKASLSRLVSQPWNDFDELGDVTGPEPVSAIKGNTSVHQLDEDELSLNWTNHTPTKKVTQVVKNRRRDENGKLVDAQWLAPPLPTGELRDRPVHRRLTVPLPLRPKLKHVDMGDWRQRGSIWDLKQEDRSDDNSHDDEKMEAELEKPIAELNMLGSANWTAAEETILRNLKATTSISNAELLKYFPGQGIESLEKCWARIEAEENQHGKPHVKLDTHASSEHQERAVKNQHSPQSESTIQRAETYNAKHDSSVKSMGLLRPPYPTDFAHVSLGNFESIHHKETPILTAANKRQPPQLKTRTTAVDSCREIPDCDSPETASSPHNPSKEEQSLFTEITDCDEKKPQQGNIGGRKRTGRVRLEGHSKVHRTQIDDAFRDRQGKFASAVTRDLSLDRVDGKGQLKEDDPKEYILISSDSDEAKPRRRAKARHKQPAIAIRASGPKAQTSEKCDMAVVVPSTQESWRRRSDSAKNIVTGIVSVESREEGNREIPDSQPSTEASQVSHRCLKEERQDINALQSAARQGLKDPAQKCLGRPKNSAAPDRPKQCPSATTNALPSTPKPFEDKKKTQSYKKRPSHPGPKTEHKVTRLHLSSGELNDSSEDELSFFIPPMTPVAEVSRSTGIIARRSLVPIEWKDCSDDELA